MALYDLFKKDKPKKKAAKKKPVTSGRGATRKRDLERRSAAAERKSRGEEINPITGSVLRKARPKKAAAKKAPAKKAAAKKTSFKSAFADARKAQGAGGTFTWNGKKYTTERADDKKKSPGSSAYNKKVRAKGPTQRIQSRMRRTRGGK
tara:strand:- start:398 stop:844 length:447 start_codon:yes stop_codon:yes gene_type:complete